MSTSLPAVEILELAAGKKKRVLLLDASATKRDMRAGVLRKQGMDVDCAADIAEARSWWRPALYDLVLVDMTSEAGLRDQFCEEVRSAKPAQPVAFLVGKPNYLADAPHAEVDLPVRHRYDDLGVVSDVKAALSADLGLDQRWGILEASRRIAAVRSACNARTRAMQSRPAPPRDMEGRPSRRDNAAPTFEDLLRRELQ
jgi:CheY-like chemotaxis protein